MESWLKESGAVGLDNLQVADFAATGRGVKAQRRFKEGEKILTIPSKTLWTVKHAHSDPLIGNVLRSVQPSLSVEDTLALYLLFVKSRDSGYEGMRGHISVMPASYSSSIFFSDEELEVCAGTSLYTLTAQLKQRVEDDYRKLIVPVLTEHRDLFPLEHFTLDDVCASFLYHVYFGQPLTCFFTSSTNGLCAHFGVARWTLKSLKETRSDS